MIEVREASFCYRGGQLALDGVSLTVRPGERVVLLGRNGSGKSTLTRLLNGSLSAGVGAVTVDGVDAAVEPREAARLVGYVRQDPRSQIVSALVTDEVAFGPRNLGLGRDEVAERVHEALETCGVAHLAERLTTELSGGQQQLLAVAGVLAMHPRYLVLDEALAQLDEASRQRMRDLVNRLVASGVGVLEVAHDPESLVGATRAVVLEGGRVTWSGSPADLLADRDALRASGLSADLLTDVLSRAAAAGWDVASAEPGTLLRLAGGAPAVSARDAWQGEGASTLAARDVELSYGDVRALAGVSFEARGLELVLGPSGSGKSSLARVLAGVLAPDSGEATLDGAPVRAGMVGLAFQRPEDMLFCDTVRDEIAYGPRAAGLAGADLERATLEAARELGVEGLLDRSPFELSGGQMRRVALAATVAARPGAYVLDEPTAGLDAPARAELRELVGSLVRSGASVVVVTHDPAAWLDVAAHVSFVREGEVVRRVTGAEAAADPAPYEAAGLVAPLAVRLRAAARGEGRRA